MSDSSAFRVKICRKSYQHLWLVEPQSDSDAVVTALTSGALGDASRQDLIVGRRNGRVDVFAFPTNAAKIYDAAPQKTFSLVGIFVQKTVANCRGETWH